MFMIGSCENTHCTYNWCKERVFLILAIDSCERGSGENGRGR